MEDSRAAVVSEEVKVVVSEKTELPKENETTSTSEKDDIIPPLSEKKNEPIIQSSKKADTTAEIATSPASEKSPENVQVSEVSVSPIAVIVTPRGEEEEKKNDDSISKTEVTAYPVEAVVVTSDKQVVSPITPRAVEGRTSTTTSPKPSSKKNNSTLSASSSPRELVRTVSATINKTTASVLAASDATSGASAKDIARLSMDAKAASVRTIKAGGEIRHTHLTCAVIKQTFDGNYEWYQNEWLLIHETLRREFLRAEHALKNMDVSKHPWHITNFYTWMSEFIVPAVHTHHEAEEEIVGPHYKALGENIEFGRSHTHEELITMLHGVEKQALFLYEATHTTNDIRSSFKMTDIKTMETGLKKSFAVLKDYMFQHLADEDTYWPDIYSRHGIATRDEVTQKIVKTDLAKKGPEAVAFKGLVGSIFDAGGFRTNKYPKPLECGLQMDPWCSVTFIDGFFASMPFVPRVFIFPGWIKDYKVKWKLMIDSVGGEVDVMQLDKKREEAATKKKFIFF